jgi:hypothetical protein
MRVIMMLGVIDRFEGEFAVIELEDDRVINMKRKDIPKEAKEGSVLNVDEEITINCEETKKRLKKIEEKTKNMWE